MAQAGAVAHRPASIEEAAELLRRLGSERQPVRLRGAGTKLDWGPSDPAPAVQVQTAGLNRILEHNEGDFTAILQAGASLADAQATFAKAGQMLALDPLLTDAEGSGQATVGGVFASGDSGPLRHRYGGVRDLILGITVVLSDGTVAKAGSRVIKNVAGYDLGKLFAASQGTLGLIATVSVRLHPIVGPTATARGHSDDPAGLAKAATRLAALPLEADCLDVGWEQGHGEVLVRFAGATATDRAEMAMGRLAELRLEELSVVEEDEPLWERQRARQRAARGAVVKVAAVISDLEAVLRAAQSLGAGVIGRAGVGLFWVTLPAGDDLDERVASLRRLLPDATLSVLDGGHSLDVAWPAPDPGALRVMERIKARFDPAGVFRPGVMVGGL